MTERYVRISLSDYQRLIGALDFTKQKRTLDANVREATIRLLDSLNTDELMASGSLYKTIIEQVEKPMLEETLKHRRYSQVKAANILGINRGTLRNKLKKYGINE